MEELTNKRWMMKMLDKVKAFFKRPKPEAKTAGEKAAEAPEKKAAESSSK